MKIKLVKSGPAKSKNLRFQLEHDDFQSYNPAIVVLQLTTSTPTAHQQRTYSQLLHRAAQLQHNYSSATTSAVALLQLCYGYAVGRLMVVC